MRTRRSSHPRLLLQGLRKVCLSFCERYVDPSIADGVLVVNVRIGGKQVATINAKGRNDEDGDGEWTAKTLNDNLPHFVEILRFNNRVSVNYCCFYSFFEKKGVFGI